MELDEIEVQRLYAESMGLEIEYMNTGLWVGEVVFEKYGELEIEAEYAVHNGELKRRLVTDTGSVESQQSTPRAILSPDTVLGLHYDHLDREHECHLEVWRWQNELLIHEEREAWCVIDEQNESQKAEWMRAGRRWRSTSDKSSDSY